MQPQSSRTVHVDVHAAAEDQSRSPPAKKTYTKDPISNAEGM